MNKKILALLAGAALIALAPQAHAQEYPAKGRTIVGIVSLCTSRPMCVGSCMVGPSVCRLRGPFPRMIHVICGMDRPSHSDWADPAGRPRAGDHAYQY